jgi:hypothetical protein
MPRTPLPISTPPSFSVRGSNRVATPLFALAPECHRTHATAARPCLPADQAIPAEARDRNGDEVPGTIPRTVREMWVPGHSQRTDPVPEEDGRLFLNMVLRVSDAPGRASRPGGPGRPVPTRDRWAGERPPVLKDDGPGDPSADLGEVDRPKPARSGACDAVGPARSGRRQPAGPGREL